MAEYTVFLDIDETLVSMKKGGPFDDDIEGIERARKQGVRFFLCTGRSMANIPKVFLEAPWVEGMIIGGGTHVILGGKVLYHSWIPVELLCKVAAHFLDVGKWCCFRGEKNVYAVNRNDDKIQINSVDDFANKYPDAKIAMMTVDLAMDDKDRVFLEQYFNIYPQGIHFDCFVRGEGKSKGMTLILETLGLDRKNSVAIGDSTNDLDIFSNAGSCVAVGNACDELKAIASWVSAPVGEGAIVKALEYLKLC